MSQITRFGWMLAFATALAGCGGAVGDAKIGGGHTTTPVTFAPAGVYVGYYQEDPISDTADAIPGALVLSLPTVSGAAVTGSMDYRFQACQTVNTAALTATRSDLGTSGTFTGTVDATTQAGSFTATLDTTALNFTGTYSNTNGKQAVTVAGCTSYTLAGVGTIELFPIDTNYPKDTFSVTYVTGTRTISWSSITGLSKVLVYVVDPSVVSAGGANPVLWQAVLDPTLSTVVPASVTLTPNHVYEAVVELSNGTRARIAFGSQSFTAP